MEEINKEQEEVIEEPLMEEQLPCIDPECLSRKKQILSISYNNVRSILNLLCLKCGRTTYLPLNSGLDAEETPKEIIKHRNYLG